MIPYKNNEYYKYKYHKYKTKYLHLKNKCIYPFQFHCIKFNNYTLIGIGDFSHGDNNVWIFRFNFLKKIINNTSNNVIIFIEDTKSHTDNIMNDVELIVGDSYNVADGKFPYGPLDRYCYRAWDSPIFLQIIKYIRKHKDRITIVGVDVEVQARDKAMSQNIINYISKNNSKNKNKNNKKNKNNNKNKNNTTTNFFWAANPHVDAREITESYELKYVPEEKFRAGFYLKQAFGDKYFIMLSTAYKGEVRFSSICNNLDCDERLFPKSPFFKKFKISDYRKFVCKNGEFCFYRKKEFDLPIAEFTDAHFPSLYFMYGGNTWDILLFYNYSDGLPLIIET